MKLRIKYMYEQGNTSYICMLFQSAGYGTAPEPALNILTKFRL